MAGGFSLDALVCPDASAAVTSTASPAAESLFLQEASERKIHLKKTGTECMMRDCALQCQSPTSQSKLRKCTGQKDSTVLAARAPLANQEDDVLPALQAGRHPAILRFRIDRLFVDLENDIAALQADVIGK